MLHRFLFTDYNRLSSVGGETSMAEMVATLSDACEREFGFLAARLFRVFKTDEIQGNITDFVCCLKRHSFVEAKVNYCKFNIKKRPACQLALSFSNG